MTTVLVVHVAVAVAAAVVGRLPGGGRRAVLVGAVAPATTVGWAVAHWGPVVREGRTVEGATVWVEQLGLALDTRVDGFSLLFLLLIGGIGTLVFAFAHRYFDERADLGRFTAVLVLFAGAMVGVVSADNLLALAVFWELTSVTSYLLIGFDDRTGSVRASALQAMLTTGLGGLALLAGVVLLGHQADTYSLQAIAADPPGGATVSVAAALVLVGACTKSAQAPFHFWLPGAMAAPTPVSAYLHSATMVKAGVYLLARLAPAFGPTIGWWRPVVVGIGLTTMLLGGYRALRQHDLKLVLAFGTVSQLGLLVVLVGAGIPALTAAGVALILAHAMAKAGLFMVVGIVDHQTHERDLRALSGLARRFPAVLAVAVAAAAAMAGLPPSLGFLAKELALDGWLDAGLTGSWVVVAVLVAGSALTVAYGARFLWGAFGPQPPGSRAAPVGPEAPRPAAVFVAPAAVLAAAGLVAGVWPALVEGLVGSAANALDPEAHPHLALWHGFTVPLGLSALVAGLGGLLFLGRAAVERWQGRLRPVWASARGYHASVAGLNEAARRVTGAVQTGSLPTYLVVILVASLLGPAVAFGSLAAGGVPDPDRVFAESPLQVLVAVLVAVAAVAATRTERRFAAAMLLGAVGYGVAVLFVLQGAADLALTQLLVETLSVVFFVLVLRLLPDRFRARPRPRRLARLALATAVGLVAAGSLLVLAPLRSGPPVSEEMAAVALPEGGGRNIVNVILVDIRGYDTLGELTVLGVAALGVVGLVRSRWGGVSLHEDDAPPAAVAEALPGASR